MQPIFAVPSHDEASGLDPNPVLHTAITPRKLSRKIQKARPVDPLTPLILMSLLAFTLCTAAAIWSARNYPEVFGVAELTGAFSDFGAPRDKWELIQALSEEDQERAYREIKFVRSIVQGRGRGIPSEELASAIVAHSRSAGLDPLLVTAVIKSESNFYPRAVSTVGATGLMQLLPSTARFVAGMHELPWAGYHRLTDPEYNIRLGVAYLTYLNREFRGDWRHTLIAYNWGPGRLSSALGGNGRIPMSPQQYANTILANHRGWRAVMDAKSVARG